MAKNDGGPAFPRSAPRIKLPPDEAVEVGRRYEGMSLRDWFAGQVISVLMASELKRALSVGEPFEIAIIVAVGSAYMVADAMLAKREKRSEATNGNPEPVRKQGE